MKKSELMDLQKKYKMQIHINVVPDGIYCYSEEPIPELEDLVSNKSDKITPCFCDKTDGKYKYIIYCQESWINSNGFIQAPEKYYDMFGREIKAYNGIRRRREQIVCQGPA